MVTGIPKIFPAIPSGLALATLRVAWVPAPDASLEAYPSVEIEATAFLSCTLASTWAHKDPVNIVSAIWWMNTQSDAVANQA